MTVNGGNHFDAYSGLQPITDSLLSTSAGGVHESPVHHADGHESAAGGLAPPAAGCGPAAVSTPAEHASKTTVGHL